MPPVAAPERMGFQASSLWRTATSEQSQTENRAPQTAKLPPNTGARYCKVKVCRGAVGGGGEVVEAVMVMVASLFLVMTEDKWKSADNTDEGPGAAGAEWGKGERQNKLKDRERGGLLANCRRFSSTDGATGRAPPTAYHKSGFGSRGIFGCAAR